MLQETPQASKRIAEFWASCSLLTPAKKYRRGSGWGSEPVEILPKRTVWSPDLSISFSQFFISYEKPTLSHGHFGSCFLFSKFFPQTLDRESEFFIDSTRFDSEGSPTHELDKPDTMSILFSAPHPPPTRIPLVLQYCKYCTCVGLDTSMYRRH